MPTRVITVNALSPDPDAMAEAAAVILRGGLVAFPTETVYGLGAHALDEGAVRSIFRAKCRPATDPVIVHLADVEWLDDIAREIPASAVALGRRFWPGALTVILAKQPAVPDALTAGLATVGVRVPSHPVARALLARAGVPIAAPSANRFARPSPTSAAHVLADLDGAIDLLLDAGPTTIGVESTIVDLTVSPPLIRRPGGVSSDEIRTILPDLHSVAERLSVPQVQPAPGQLLRHYAPRAPLTLYLGTVERVAERIAREARGAAASGSRVGILAPEEDLLALAPRLAASAAAGRIVTVRFGARRDADRAAQELFRALRALDDEGLDVILASAPDAGGIGEAIVDRLTRAAEGRVVRLDETARTLIPRS